MAAKNKAASIGAGAVAAGKAARENAYIQRLIEDEALRENLRTAYESARSAYARMSNGKGPSAALNDKKTQKQLREAATSLKDAADALREAKRPRKRRGRGLMLIVVGIALAFVLSEGLRKKALDTLFGAEEEFEYTSPTTPASNGGSSSSTTPAGAAS
jgi:adenylosuccinate synthase